LTLCVDCEIDTNESVCRVMLSNGTARTIDFTKSMRIALEPCVKEADNLQQSDGVLRAAQFSNALANGVARTV
jgi:hypothetical protein